MIPVTLSYITDWLVKELPVTVVGPVQEPQPKAAGPELDLNKVSPTNYGIHSDAKTQKHSEATDASVLAQSVS